MRVKSVKKLMSDDRENGIDDGSPIIYPGTYGELVGPAKGKLYKGNREIDGPLWLVKFPKITWALTEKEFKVIQ